MCGCNNPVSLFYSRNVISIKKEYGFISEEGILEDGWRFINSLLSYHPYFLPG